MLTAVVVAMLVVPVVFLALARQNVPQKAYRRVRIRPDA
jgi:hypothetical protein